MNRGSHILKRGSVRLSCQVKLREEYFGGIIFHKGTGDTIEVDREAYKMLLWLQKTGAANVQTLSRQKQVRNILFALLDINIVEYLPEETAPNTIDCRCVPYQDYSKLSEDTAPADTHCRSCLSAPETVHLAVTYRCAANCPDCYAQGRVQSADYELGTSEMCGIIDTFADNGIFQLAIGGGEPFVRPDLGYIVSHADEKDLAVHITTGQYTLKPQNLDILSRIKSLHIGIRSEELIHDAVNTSEKLRVLAEYAHSAGIGIGANLIIKRFTIQNIDRLTELLLKCGFKRLIFLRYKPIANQARWNNENPGTDELKLFKNWLVQASYKYPEVMLRIDCASAFLMRDTDFPTAMYAGIKGCAAGERIISVAPDGSVYPCSQFAGHDYSAGNLTRDTFKSIWYENDLLNKYRNFRQSDTFIGGVCGQCSANRFCGGCRIFAKDAIGSEEFCPIK